MAHHHDELSQALGPGSADVILLEHLHHTASGLAQQAADVEDGQHHTGHDDVGEQGGEAAGARVVHAAHGQDLQLDGEEVDEHQPGEEGGGGGPDERQAGGDVVPGGVGLIGGHDPQGHRHQDGHNGGGEGEDQRGPQPLHHHPPYRLPGAVGDAQVALEHGAQPFEVLDDNRLVQPQLVLQRLHVLHGGHGVGQQHLQRAAGGHGGDQVHQYGDAEEGGYGYEKPF